MKTKDKISVFGSNGFIGSAFLKNYPAESLYINSTIDYPQSKEILYLRSTTTNYNVLTDPYLDIKVNLIKLMDVLKWCKDKDITFTYVSSWFVLGSGFDVNARGGYGASEHSHCDPKGFYSITKYCAEKLLTSYCETFDIKYRILRLSNVIGPGDKFSAQKNALQFLIEKLKKNENIELYNYGNFWRNYLHVDEVCRAIKFVMENGELNSIYNIGNNEDHKFIDLISYCVRQLESESIITGIEPKDFHKKIQVQDFRMNVNKLKNLGFEWNQTIWESLDDILK